MTGVSEGYIICSHGCQVPLYELQPIIEHDSAIFYSAMTPFREKTQQFACSSPFRLIRPRCSIISNKSHHHVVHYHLKVSKTDGELERHLAYQFGGLRRSREASLQNLDLLARA